MAADSGIQIHSTLNLFSCSLIFNNCSQDGCKVSQLSCRQLKNAEGQTSSFGFFFRFSAWLFALGETRQRLAGHFSTLGASASGGERLDVHFQVRRPLCLELSRAAPRQKTISLPGCEQSENTVRLRVIRSAFRVLFFLKHVYTQKKVKSQGRFYSREARQEAAFTVGKLTSEYAQG